MIEKSLPARQFDNVIHWIKTVDAERLDFLKVVVDTTMTRLGLKYKRRASVKGTPPGSDQLDTGSIADWLGRVMPQDVDAIAQVVAIHATLVSRLGG